MARARKKGARYKCGKLRQPEYEPFRKEFIRDTTDERTNTRSIKNEGSTALDRLLFRHLISVLQQYAGQQYERLWQRYRALYLGAPRPISKVAQYERGLGYESDEREDLASAREYEQAFRLLRQRRRGREIVLALHNVVLYGCDPPEGDLFMIKRGLNLLCAYFKIRA